MTEPQLNNLNACYEDYELRTHQTEMNINSSPPEEGAEPENPPPIPPKSGLAGNSLNSSLDLGSLERPKRREISDVASPENYSLPKLQKENGSMEEKSCDH